MKKRKEIEKEIFKHLPDKGNPDGIVVHRSTSSVIVAKTRENSKKRSQNEFNSTVGNPFEPIGNINRVTPIIRIIHENYFDEKISEKFLNFEEDKGKNVFKKIQTQTLSLKKKVEALKCVKDEKKEVIRTEVHNSANRLQNSKFGRNFDKKTEETDESFKIPTERRVVVPNKGWEVLKTKERDKSFEEKLRFYQESPRMAKRRNLTQHFP